MTKRFSALLFLTLLVLSSWGTPTASARGLECVLLPGLFRAYLMQHYAYHDLSDEIRKRTIEQFIKSLDPSKVQLLEDDVAKMRAELPKVFDKMSSGDCDALRTSYDVLKKRVKENEASARVFLNDAYQVDEKVEFLFDPDKRSYFKTEQEKQEFQKKYVHFQVFTTILAGTKLPEAKKQVIHRYELSTKRVEEKTMDDLYDLFAMAFSTSLDPHSTYMSQKNLEEFEIQMRLSLEGIGAVLSSQDGYTVIEEIIPGGGADRSKQVRPKDKIIAVGQQGEKAENVIDMDLSDVVRRIRGKKGTKVTLTLLRQTDKTERLEITIVRDKIDIKDQEAKLTFEHREINGKKAKIAVIDLPSFYGEGRSGKKSSYTDMKKLVEKAAAEKADGLVLNLARNGGGLLDDAVRISGLFIDRGGIVATQDSRNNVQVLSDTDKGMIFNGPMVVLTSRLSASASEILAGALKDYHRAVIVGGDHTFGKGSVQVVNQLPGGLGAIKVTTGMFFLPSGISTQHGGVPVDVSLPSLFNKDEVGEKALDYSLRPNAIKSFISPEANALEAGKGFVTITSPIVEQLAKNSTERVAKNSKFTELKKEIAESEKNKGWIRLAELKSKNDGEQKKKKDEEKKKRADRQKDEDAPYIDESINILVDLIRAEKSA